MLCNSFLLEQLLLLSTLERLATSATSYCHVTSSTILDHDYSGLCWYYISCCQCMLLLLLLMAYMLLMGLLHLQLLQV